MALGTVSWFLPANPFRHRTRRESRDLSLSSTTTISGSTDYDAEVPFDELEPFGREETAQELTEQPTHKDKCGRNVRSVRDLTHSRCGTFSCDCCLGSRFTDVENRVPVHVKRLFSLSQR